MMEENQKIDEMISSFVSGEIDDESFSMLESWSKDSDENRRYVRDRIDLLFSSGVIGDTTEVNEKTAYDRFLNRAHVYESYSRRSSSLKYFFLAAAILILLVLLPVSFNSGKKSIQNAFTDIVVEASPGTSTKLSLPDGSKVWLNAGSRISYSQGFGVKDRNIELVGEGYFEVTHDSEKPFIVKTKELSLKVTGTKFNFQNYPDDYGASISLLEGSVLVRNEMKHMADFQLKPNEMARLNKMTGSLDVSKKNVEYSNIWKDNKLFFDEETMDEIARKISRSYGVQVEVDEPLKDICFYGDFTITKTSIEEIFSIISSTCGIKYRHEGTKYILY